jgi:hypothetical protein
MQAADDPQHPRNIDHAKYETKENRKAQSELNRGGAAFTGNKCFSNYCSLSSAVLVIVWLDARLKPVKAGVYE